MRDASAGNTGWGMPPQGTHDQPSHLCGSIVRASAASSTVACMKTVTECQALGFERVVSERWSGDWREQAGERVLLRGDPSVEMGDVLWAIWGWDGGKAG
eukprot:364757-Chlamydomonas_euryale.AAC.5